MLWGIFPNHKKILGAPLNVTVRSAFFNNNVALVSVSGNDELGRTVLDYLKRI